MGRGCQEFGSSSMSTKYRTSLLSTALSRTMRCGKNWTPSSTRGSQDTPESCWCQLRGVQKKFARRNDGDDRINVVLQSNYLMRHVYAKSTRHRAELKR